MHPSLASSRRVPVLASLGAVVVAGALWLSLTGVPCWAQASAPVAAASSPAPAASAAARRTGVAKAASAAKANGKQPTKPLWTELTEAQRQALAPLAPKWDTVSEAQKRKWLALSQNYPRMSGAEQELLHSRMTEWAALSPQQRTQARLNFGEAKQISPDDKKAKWEAYQALPPEEKRKLAAGAAKPPATAAAVKPVPADKLATVPPPKRVVKAPRIAAGPHQVDPNTLLPQPAAAGPN
ncbi:MAG: DUF3106 domain-containing protein [Ramlibacter sp.]|nr:DUF3106 domain-containing protein [Ramlibacter sp.]